MYLPGRIGDRDLGYFWMGRADIDQSVEVPSRWFAD
jgi:hypothetical protein|tara:strand:+ start:88 stop:195 length:108 start_codon:yes stop_codon:yes gene_type:complete